MQMWQNFPSVIKAVLFALINLCRCLFLPVCGEDVEQITYPLKLLIALKYSKNNLSVLKINTVILL